MSKRHCLTLDLKNDRDSIQQYEDHHKRVWPEVIASIKDAGIELMEIYRYETRLVMIMQVSDDFSFADKAKTDSMNKKVQEWEDLMGSYQQPLVFGSPGWKWQLMNKIFDLNEF